MKSERLQWICVLLALCFVMIACSDTTNDATDGDAPDGDGSDGDVVDGDIADGDIADGDIADGDGPDGDLPDGDRDDSPADGDMDPDSDPDGDADGDAEIAASLLIGDLRWQNPPNAETRDWDEAADYCATLDLAGYSDWRLPTIGDLRQLIDGCTAVKPEGSCNVGEADCLALDCRDDACDGCSPNSGPNGGCYWQDGLAGVCGWYWSSTDVSGSDGGYWLVEFSTGGIGDDFISGSNGVRCVREENPQLDGDSDSDGDSELDDDGDWDADAEPDDESVELPQANSACPPAQAGYQACIGNHLVTCDSGNLKWRVFDCAERTCLQNSFGDVSCQTLCDGPCRSLFAWRALLCFDEVPDEATHDAMCLDGGYVLDLDPLIAQHTCGDFGGAAIDSCNEDDEYSPYECFTYEWHDYACRYCPAYGESVSMLDDDTPLRPECTGLPEFVHACDAQREPGCTYRCSQEILRLISGAPTDAEYITMCENAGGTVVKPVGDCPETLRECEIADGDADCGEACDPAPMPCYQLTEETEYTCQNCPLLQTGLWVNDDAPLPTECNQP